jgi:hypothetical protein
MIPTDDVGIYSSIEGALCVRAQSSASESGGVNKGQEGPKRKHVFRQDDPGVLAVALGENSVRILAIHHLIRRYNLDAVVVPPRTENKDLTALWRIVLGVDHVVSDANSIPAKFKDARVSAPSSLDWFFGSTAWTVFEGVMWESGFFDTSELRVDPPLVFPCDHRAHAVMIYPVESTQGNRVYDSDFWIATCALFRRRGYSINHLGTRHHPNLARFYSTVEFDRHFDPTIENLAACAAASSVAIGSSTGPTWTLLFSDIEQIVLEAKQPPHDCWFFDRCNQVLSKRLHIFPTLDSLIRDCEYVPKR